MAVHVRLFKERVRLVVDRFLVLDRVVGCCLRKKNCLCRQPELEIWSSGKMVAQMDY